MGVLDFGFSAYGLIGTQTAARIGASWGAVSPGNAVSSSLSTKVCGYATAALKYAPGVSTSSCGGTSPVSVSTSYNASGADGLPTLTVTVNYTLSLLFIPNISPASITLSRSVQLPVRN